MSIYLVIYYLVYIQGVEILRKDEKSTEQFNLLE